MLNIPRRGPYIILPAQRYELSTYEPHTVMQGDFTMWCEFKVNTEDLGQNFGVCMRPGMHMGFCVKTESDGQAWVGFDYWSVLDGENKWDSMVYHVQEPKTYNEKYFCFVQHSLEDKRFTYFITDEKYKVLVSGKRDYEGVLQDYSNTSFNLGCGNYQKGMPERDKYFADINLYNLGLIANKNYSYEDIWNFIDKTKNDKRTLSQPMDDLVFYYNFKEKNLFKVWDLSGHCNFAAKNTYEDDLI